MKRGLRGLSRLVRRGEPHAGLAAQLDRIERKLDALEHLSHGARSTYMGGNRILVKSVVHGRNIALFVEADDRLLSPWFIVSGTYETDLTDYFVGALREDSHCVDVGANFGYYTCLMARFCPNGRIVGIEADHKVWELARDNIFINGFNESASAINAAAGNSDGDVTLFRRNLRSGNTSVIQCSDSFTSAMGEPPSEAFSVRGMRVDSLLDAMDGRVDFLKIDVEGAEPAVLLGARETIAANPQLRIVMEWSPGQMQAAGHDLHELVDLILGQGLRAYDIKTGTPLFASPDAIAATPYHAGIVLRRLDAG